ncbi:MAG: hypothetical protein KBS81_11725, partial [Spirochaetales bacterium]|nr:hypothetical protein [Candidatus Physcosoma equi]
MAFERVSDDYEDFEPEVRIWPYVALAFLLQMVPVLLSVALGEKNYFTLFLRSFYGLFPLLYTASILRHGEKPWRLALSGVLYGVMELILWVTASVGGAKGYALGLPFGLVLYPS